MMNPDQLPPTRATLLELRRELDQAIQGHAILERKRETLLRELWDLFSEVKHTEREVRERCERAYKVQREARLLMGMVAMRFAARSAGAKSEYLVEVRSLMGLSLPL